MCLGSVVAHGPLFDLEGEVESPWYSLGLLGGEEDGHHTTRSKEGEPIHRRAGFGKRGYAAGENRIGVRQNSTTYMPGKF